MASARVGGAVIGAFALAGVLTLVALVVDDSTVGWALTFPIVMALVYTMVRLPLRTSLLWIMFCALTLENPSELPAAGHWKSPLYIIGALLLTHLNGVTGVSYLFFSGMDVLLVTLLLVAFYRRVTNSKIDRFGRIPTPEPLIKLALVSFAGIAYVWVSGLLRGGSNVYALWQIDRVIYLPVVFLLFHMAVRGARDHAAFAKVLLAAAVIKSCVAVYVMNTVTIPPDIFGNTTLAYATSHHDSILFACAFVLLGALMIHGYPGSRRWSLWIMPILIAGMINNGRRMVWVQIGMAFITLYFATPMNATKYKIRKVVWALIPLLVLYVVVGWNHPTGLFSPVKTIRGVVEPDMDLSSQTREIENYDLISTVRMHPFLGTGYGNGYAQLIGLPPMGYDLELYNPHNSILGLWAYGGYFGFTALTVLWVAGVYFAMRGYAAARSAEDRTAALMSYAAVLIYLVQCWGDMGLGSWTGVFIVGSALAFGGKLCVATGAWETKSRTSKRASVPAAADIPQARVERV